MILVSLRPAKLFSILLASDHCLHYQTCLKHTDTLSISNTFLISLSSTSLETGSLLSPIDNGAKQIDAGKLKAVFRVCELQLLCFDSCEPADMVLKVSVCCWMKKAAVKLPVGQHPSACVCGCDCVYCVWGNNVSQLVQTFCAITQKLATVGG